MLRFDSLKFALLVVATLILLLGACMIFVQSQRGARDKAVAEVLTGGRPERGEMAILRYGCAGCHTIPDVPGADGLVGPQLADLRKRVFIAGVIRNTGPNLVKWIVDPRSLSPATAMPATGISVVQARDVAAFLYAH
jgi:cytochrome c2